MNLKITISLFCYLWLSSSSLFSQATQLPIHFADNLILIEGTINDRTGLLVLDLGISDLVLNKAYFDGKMDSGLGAYGLNGTQSALETSVVSLNLGTFSWENQRATLLSLTHLEQAKGKKILGLIGGKLFKKYELAIDLGKMEVQIVKDNEGDFYIDNESQTSYPEAVIPFNYKGGMPWIEVQINHAFFKFGIDTASESNLISTKHLPFLENLVSKKRILESRGVSGETKQVLAANVAAMEIGLLSCYPMRTLFTDLSKINQNLAGTTLDGILGFDLFRQFKVAVDYKNAEIRLWRHQSNPNVNIPLLLTSQLVSDTSTLILKNNKKPDH